MIALASRIVDNPLTERVILILIVLNAITLGLETSETAMQAAGPLLLAFDHVVLAVFVIELTLRLIARRSRFFRDPWSIFDLTVVAVSLVPAAGNLSVLRSFRVLRVLRLITSVPSLKRVVAALIGSLPGMSSIFLLLMLLLYVFAVMATKLYAADFPEKFGTIGGSMYTLFQLMTLDGWSGEIVRPVMEVHPWSWLFFIAFIAATAFTLFNLFIGVVVGAMQSEHERERAEITGEPPVTLYDLALELRAVRAELGALRRELGEDKQAA